MVGFERGGGRQLEHLEAKSANEVGGSIAGGWGWR